MARALDRNEKFWAVMLKSGGRCWYCGARIWPENEEHRATVDHLEARVNGGDCDFANLVPACARCNSSKCNRDLEEMRHNAAQRSLGMPAFSREQIAWLRRKGFDLNKYDAYRFWFESHKTRHIEQWTIGKLRSEINLMLRRHHGL